MKQIFYLILITSPLIVNGNTDTLTNIPNDRFKGGKEEFYKSLQQAIGYPLNAREKLSIGTEIVMFQVIPSGEIGEIEVLNSISTEIDNAVIKAIKLIKKKWLPGNSDTLVFILPIYFKIKNCDFLRNEFPTKLCPEIAIYAFGSASNKVFQSDNQLIESYLKSKGSMQFNESLKTINELIARNPYNSELFKERIEIKKALNLSYCSDLFFMKRILLEKVNFPDCH